MRAELAVTPAHRTQVIKAGLFVGERFEEIKQAGKVGDHDVVSFLKTP
jgi:hypothetical protein